MSAIFQGKDFRKSSFFSFKRVTKECFMPIKLWKGLSHFPTNHGIYILESNTLYIMLMILFVSHKTNVENGQNW